MIAGAAHVDLEAEWSRAVKVLGGARQVCLACHVRPDADALGSMLAMAHALRADPGRTVIASFGDEPFAVPANLRFLPGTGLAGTGLAGTGLPGTGLLTPPAGYPARPAVMVTFDAAGADRLGALAAPAGAADELIVLDHHASSTAFGTIRLVDPAAAATAVLARELIARIGVPVGRDIALGLYAGLVADTGSFKFSTTPRLHQLAAELIGTGIDPGTVARELFDRAPFGYLGLLSAVLGRAVLEPEAAGGLGLVWTQVTRADRERAGGLPMDAVEPVIDTVRRTDEAEVAVVLKEADNGDWLVSARSKDHVDVGRACKALGGGGHARAAGFTAVTTAADAIAALRGPLVPVTGSGLLIIDKPPGLTSHDVVARVRRLAGTRRVGHAGTLDPMATGVLVTGIEKATRLLGHLTLTEKEYAATIRLGQRTDTDDADGEIVATEGAGGVADAALHPAAAALTGEIMQVPPGISAIKVGGKRAYRLTREGAPPELAARPVTVSELRITATRRVSDPAGPLLDVDVVVTCSSGTYIRAIARDLGQALGAGGHLTALRRTRVGPYAVAAATRLDDLDPAALPVIPLAAAAAAAFASRQLTGEQARVLGHGGRLPASGDGPGPVAAFAPDGSLVALLTEQDGQARSLAVFAGQ